MTKPQGTRASHAPKAPAGPPKRSKNGSFGALHYIRKAPKHTLFTVNIFIKSTNRRMFCIYHLLVPSVITTSRNRAPIEWYNFSLNCPKPRKKKDFDKKDFGPL